MSLHVYKAIQTKYVSATNTKGSRLKAWSEGNKPIFVSYDHDYDGQENHAHAAVAFAKKMKWEGTLIGGGLPDGSLVWVFKKSGSIEIK